MSSWGFFSYADKQDNNKQKIHICNSILYSDEEFSGTKIGELLDYNLSIALMKQRFKFYLFYIIVLYLNNNVKEEFEKAVSFKGFILIG